LVHGPAIPVVLHGKVLAPDGRVFGLIGEFHDAKEGISRFLLPLEYRDQQDHAEDRADGGEQH
jgi:hypothetical protein